MHSLEKNSSKDPRDRGRQSPSTLPKTGAHADKLEHASYDFNDAHGGGGTRDIHGVGKISETGNASRRIKIDHHAHRGRSRTMIR